MKVCIATAVISMKYYWFKIVLKAQKSKNKFDFSPWVIPQSKTFSINFIENFVALYLFYVHLNLFYCLFPKFQRKEDSYNIVS